MAEADSGAETNVSEAESREPTVEAITGRADSLFKLTGLSTIEVPDPQRHGVSAVVLTKKKGPRPYHISIREPSVEPGKDVLHSYKWSQRGGTDNQKAIIGHVPISGWVDEVETLPISPRYGFDEKENDYSQIHAALDTVEDHVRKVLKSG